MYIYFTAGTETVAEKPPRTAVSKTLKKYKKISNHKEFYIFAAS